MITDIPEGFEVCDKAQATYGFNPAFGVNTPHKWDQYGKGSCELILCTPLRHIKKPAPDKSPAEQLVDSIVRRHKKSLAEVERLAIAAVRKAVFARRHASDVREFKSKCMKGKR
jgi:hypothetical protein